VNSGDNVAKTSNYTTANLFGEELDERCDVIFEGTVTDTEDPSQEISFVKLKLTKSFMLVSVLGWRKGRLFL